MLIIIWLANNFWNVNIVDFICVKIFEAIKRDLKRALVADAMFTVPGCISKFIILSVVGKVRTS